MNKYQEATQYHQNGNLIQAESIYRDLLRTEPNNIDFLHLLSIVLAQQDKNKEALQHIKKAVKHDNNNPTLHNSLGNIYKRLSKFKKASEAYHEALTLNPSNATTLNNLAALSFHEENYDDAISHYQSAIRLNSNYSDAHYNLGLCFQKTTDERRAIHHFEQTVKLDPKHHDAHYQLGALLLSENKYVKSIIHLKKHIELEPHHVEALNNLGAALMKTGEFEQATHYLRQVMAHDNQHIEGLHNLGMAYVNLNQSEHALRCYTQLIPRDPCYEVYFNLGTLHMHQDRFKESLEYFDLALKIKPNDADTFHNLGLCYLKQTKLKESIEHYKKALNLQPNNQDIIYVLSGLENKKTYSRAPIQFIKKLFDNYAPHFENHLTQYLNYNVPQQLFDLVKNTINRDNLTVLDLGCGSGLCGEKFKPLSKKITGIDLSAKMIEHARQKNVYDKLNVDDIEKYLSLNKGYDLIIAGDVFTYIGDLEAIFHHVYAALNKDGAFAFTTEKLTHNTERFHLQTNMRYAHEKRYIEALAEQYHFTVEACHNAKLRTEHSKPVEGYIYLLIN